MLPSTTLTSAMQTTNWRRWLLMLALATYVVCYAPLMAGMVEVWSTNPLFSYGFVIPVICAYVVWTRAELLRSIQPLPDYALGCAVTFAGAALLAVGQVGAVIALQGISLVVTLAGLVLLLFGRRIFAISWFPIAYLLVMVPIWHDPISRFQLPSQLLSARIAVAFLHLVGVPAMQQGTIITLPTLTLEVLRECSGVNQLVALLAMVIPVAYLWVPTLPRRAFLIATAVIVGYVSNGFRIALVGWLAVKGLGDGNPQSPVHLLQGLLVSLVGYVALLGMVSVLTRKAPFGKVSAGSRILAPLVSPRRPWLEVVVLVVLLVSASTQRISARLNVPLDTGLQSLPQQIGRWTVDSYPEPAIVAPSGPGRRTGWRIPWPCQNPAICIGGRTAGTRLPELWR